MSSIKQKFCSSIRRGTGEAYLLAKQYADVDFSKYIIDACIHCYAYDGQCESSRAPYLFDLILLSSNQDKIREAIFEGIACIKEDTYDLAQLFDLACLYAKQGDKQTYKIIYSYFYKNLRSGLAGNSGLKIIDIDGLSGLLFVADKIGKYIGRSGVNFEDDFYINYFQKHYPDLDVYAELEKAAIDNNNICTYLSCIQETKARYNELLVQRPVYDNIIDEIEHSKWFRPVLRKLAEEEIKQIADKFLSEKNKEKKAKFLKVFSWVKYPYDYEILLAIAKGYSNTFRIKEYALQALQHIQADEVRELALCKVSKTTQPATYTNLLLSNYRAGDEVLLTNIANKFNSEDIIEDLVRSYIQIYTLNRTKDCKEPLEALYSKSNCGIHRNDIVRILIENSVLSESIREEIQFDSDKDTRAFAKDLCNT